MHIEVNSAIARKMVERLRSSVGHTRITQSLAYETLARTLGSQSWDELSGLLEREAAASKGFKLRRTFSLLVEAWNIDPNGVDPDWVRVPINQKMIDEILELQRETLRLGTEFIATRATASWGNPEAIRTIHSELRVYKDEIFFRAMDKHQGHDVNSRLISIAELLQAIQDERPNQVNGSFLWKGNTLVCADAPQAFADAHKPDL